METGKRPASIARLEQLAELFVCPVVRFFQTDNDNEAQDELSLQLQTLADILLTLEPSEKILLVDFMADAARLFKIRTK
jgi:hypothetical protein